MFKAIQVINKKSKFLRIFVKTARIGAMKILGIESSCDETGIALYDSEQGLLADVVHSQVDLHADYGGVVPELASRDHVVKAAPLLDDLLQEIGGISAIDGIAYTRGPGLIGAPRRTPLPLH